MIQRTAIVGPLQCNCVLLGCEKTKEAVLIDPGDEAQRLIEMVEKIGLKVKYLLHTHAHFDHVGATAEVKAKLGGTTCLHTGDQPLYDNLPMQCQLFGFPVVSAPPLEKVLTDEEILTFGDHRLQVIHTPGHSPGGLCFKLLDGNEDLFSGDTLFQGSVGRTDLWGGDTDQLLQSIRRRLFVLDDGIAVHPGHGPSTEIGIEKRTNPFLS